MRCSKTKQPVLGYEKSGLLFIWWEVISNIDLVILSQILWLSPRMLGDQGIFHNLVGPASEIVILVK